MTQRATAAARSHGYADVDPMEMCRVAKRSRREVGESALVCASAVASYGERPLDGGPYPYVCLDALALSWPEAAAHCGRCPGLECEEGDLNPFRDLLSG